MKLFFLIVSLSCTLFLSSCVKLPAKVKLPAEYVSRSSVEYTNHPKTNITTVIHHVFIDPSFKSDTKSQIEDGFDEWNTVLNGYDKFVVSKRFRPLNENMSSFDYTVVNISPMDAEEMLIPDEVLGWVDDLGDHTINLLEYRMTDEDVRVLLMHEMGHALGLPHLPMRGVIMNPVFPNAPCITEADVRELVYIREGRYDINHLNWCMYSPN